MDILIVSKSLFFGNSKVMECHLWQQAHLDHKSIKELHIKKHVFNCKFLGFDEVLSSYTIAEYLLFITRHI